MQYFTSEVGVFLLIVVEREYNQMGNNMKTYMLHADNARELILSNISISDKDYEMGNPYNTTLIVKVKSGAFAGLALFEIDIADFCTFANELFYLYTNLRGKVTLQDICYGSTIEFEVVDRVGHIQICGEIFGEAMLHSIKFEFRIDQTDLHLFSKSLFADFAVLEKYKNKATFNQS